MRTLFLIGPEFLRPQNKLQCYLSGQLHTFNVHLSKVVVFATGRIILLMLLVLVRYSGEFLLSNYCIVFYSDKIIVNVNGVWWLLARAIWWLFLWLNKNL